MGNLQDLDGAHLVRRPVGLPPGFCIFPSSVSLVILKEAMVSWEQKGSLSFVLLVADRIWLKFLILALRFRATLMLEKPPLGRG